MEDEALEYGMRSRALQRACRLSEREAKAALARELGSGKGYSSSMELSLD
jgi:hypothetical protein